MSTPPAEKCPLCGKKIGIDTSRVAESWLLALPSALALAAVLGWFTWWVLW